MFRSNADFGLRLGGIHVGEDGRMFQGLKPFHGTLGKAEVRDWKGCFYVDLFSLVFRYILIKNCIKLQANFKVYK